MDSIEPIEDGNNVYRRNQSVATELSDDGGGLTMHVNQNYMRVANPNPTPQAPARKSVQLEAPSPNPNRRARLPTSARSSKKIHQRNISRLFYDLEASDAKTNDRSVFDMYSLPMLKVLKNFL